MQKKTPKSKYSKAEIQKLEQILQQPAFMLPMLGVDPASAKREIENFYKDQTAQPEINEESLTKQNKALWNNSLEYYIETL